jgi:hypothetical protein
VYSDCSRQQSDINCTVEIFIGKTDTELPFIAGVMLVRLGSSC